MNLPLILSLCPFYRLKKLSQGWGDGAFSKHLLCWLEYLKPCEAPEWHGAGVIPSPWGNHWMPYFALPVHLIQPRPPEISISTEGLPRSDMTMNLSMGDHIGVNRYRRVQPTKEGIIP